MSKDRLPPKRGIFTLTKGAQKILIEADPAKKVILTQFVATAWRKKQLNQIGRVSLPERPARPKLPKLLPARDMPHRRPKSGKGRLALMHAIAHIELNAIDLAWDLIARFSEEDLPQTFYNDWVDVAVDEARHFTMLAKYLTQQGAFYGAFPAHDGLWEAANNTSDDILARLAIVPLVLEARGLDTIPGVIKKLLSANDQAAAKILKVIGEDEITHVAAGVKWFNFICERRQLEPAITFQLLVKKRFNGVLKPPFMIDSRTLAGFPREYYEPLTHGN